MIVPMKKLHVIVRSVDADSAVRSLAGLGVLHVEHSQPPSGKDISSLQEDLSVVSGAIDILTRRDFREASAESRGKFLKDWRAMAKHILDLIKRLDQLGEYSRMLENRIKEWEEWGDFDPNAVTRLAASGIFIKLYRIPSSDIKNLSERLIVKRIGKSKGMELCAVTSRRQVELPYPEAGLPKSSLGEMRSRLSENRSMMKTIKGDICRHVRYLENFQNIKAALSRELDLHEALKGMASSGAISYITGYVPLDALEKIEKKAGEERWGIFVKDPSEDDIVPTLIRNPRWVSIISPVFKLIEVIPGYREIDISPLFLLFLSLFFGMIIGDAGYGLLYIALTALAHKKMGPKLKDKRIFFLLYLFSSSAVLWGILTGTFFGQEWYSRAGLGPVLPILNDTKFLQAFCFFLGAFHLTLGHTWQAIRKFPSVTALADAGWILVLWTAFFLARTLILDIPMPPFTKWLIVGGISLVVFCTSPQKNIFKMVGTGLGTLALSIMNNFTDVVSYVRLFAVGLAGIAISDTVNALAVSLGGGSLVLKMIILFHGHAINILLGPISVLVHGIRLNVLEFSNHAGLSWSGTAYKPLKS